MGTQDFMDQLEEIISFFPPYAKSFYLKFNNKQNEKYLHDFYEKSVRMDDLQDILFRFFSKIPSGRKLIFVETCYNELNSLDHSIEMIKVMAPMLERLKKIPEFYILHREGDVDAWESVQNKIISLIRIAYVE